MSDNELFKDLLQAFYEYEDVLAEAEEAEEEMEAISELPIAEVDQAEAELKRAFDLYVIDLIKRNR
jgi:hypothetical protein